MIAKCEACGAHVPAAVMIEVTVGGERRRFCSARCTDAIAAEPLPALPPLPRHILVAVDGSGPSLRAAEVATALAASLGADIRLLTAVDASGLHALAMRENIGVRLDGLANEVARVMHKDAEAQLRRCRRICERASVPCVATIETGPPLDAILAAAGGVDLVVMGSRGRGALSGTPLGSLSQRVVTSTSTPVLVVH